MAFAQHHHRTKQQQQQEQQQQQQQQQQQRHHHEQQQTHDHEQQQQQDHSRSSGNLHHPLLMKTDALLANVHSQNKRRQRRSAAAAVVAATASSSAHTTTTADPIAAAAAQDHQPQTTASADQHLPQSASASAHDWTLVFPGRQHSPPFTQDPFLTDEQQYHQHQHHQLPTSPSAILDFPHASFAQQQQDTTHSSSHGLGFAHPEADPTHFSTSSLAWSLPSAPSEPDGGLMYHEAHHHQQQSRDPLPRNDSNASSSVLSLSTSSFSSGILTHDPSGPNTHSQAFSLVSPPSPSAVSAGTGSVRFSRTGMLSPPAATLARTESRAGGENDELLHLPAPPSTEAGASSSAAAFKQKGQEGGSKSRRRRKARNGSKPAAGGAEDRLEDGTGSRVTSSSEDSDDQDGRSSKRSNNSGSAALRRRTARRNGKAAAAAAAGGTAIAGTAGRLSSGEGSRLQLRGDGITVLRPTTQVQNNKDHTDEGTEEGKLARRPASASTRLISAILRKLFTLEPDVLDAFLLGSEGHVLGHSATTTTQPLRTSGTGSNASRSVSTASSRPRRTVRFAELGGGVAGEDENVRPYEYGYRTFAAAYQHQQQQQFSSGRRSRSAAVGAASSETVSTNPVLAIARAAERAEGGVDEDEEDEVDGLELVKIDPDGGGASSARRTRMTKAESSTGSAFEHPIKQTRSAGEGQAENDDEVDASSGPLRRSSSTQSLTSTRQGPATSTTYAESSSAVVFGGATMMEPTAWEAIRALFDERLARQAYSFHEGIGLPLSLRLLRWVLGRSGMWSGGQPKGRGGGRRRRGRAVVGGIGWDGVEETEGEDDGEEGRDEDGLFSSEVGDFSSLVGGEAVLFGDAEEGGGGGGGASSSMESEAVKRERERREWERAWARGVALASAAAAAAHASASTEPSEVGGDEAAHGGAQFGYHARSYSAYDLSRLGHQHHQGYYNEAAGDGGEYLSPHAHGRTPWTGANRAMAHFHHHQQQGGMYPSHFASYGDLPAIAASIETSFGPSFHQAQSQQHSSSSLSSPSSALGLGTGTAGVGGAVHFRPTVQKQGGGSGQQGLLESDDGRDADEEGSTSHRAHSRRFVG
ncbi:hypothetical protein CF327_g3196 [Tilletia walkeri]|uniref:Uncharacterized protein n=1 Tax=Tilletia walkeri TaxID=117179 RepID=A0A8X7N4A1_9BASI|nr:hypothetical protein CF327_g3196 [Tilletia walkeri]KAE8266821.1 hypothetical protein A4X09_0g5526 [Tilletia walkeri]